MASTKVRLNVERRESFAEGAAFGDTGPYERLLGKVEFAIDPEEPGLPFIVDLDLAPRNAEGLVEFQADFEILKPVEAGAVTAACSTRSQSRRQRGAPHVQQRRTRRRQGAARRSRQRLLHAEGYTVVWCGWQGDLISAGGNVVAYLPEARENGQTGARPLRQEFVVDTEGVLSLPVSGRRASAATRCLTVPPPP